jgi:hypothetical protein
VKTSCPEVLGRICAMIELKHCTVGDYNEDRWYANPPVCIICEDDSDQWQCFACTTYGKLAFLLMCD